MQSGKEFLMTLPDDEIEAALEHTASAIASANINRSTFLAMSDDEFDQLAIEQDVSERDLTTAFLYWTLFSTEPIAFRVSALTPGYSRLSDALLRYIPTSPLRDILRLVA